MQSQGFGGRIAALEQDVAELKRQMQAIVNSLGGGGEGRESEGPRAPREVRKSGVEKARGLEFIKIGGVNDEVFENMRDSVKKSLSSIRDLNCAIYMIFAPGARVDYQDFTPTKSPAIIIAYGLGLTNPPSDASNGLRMFQMDANDSFTRLKDSIRNQDTLEKIISYVKRLQTTSSIRSCITCGNDATHYDVYTGRLYCSNSKCIE